MRRTLAFVLATLMLGLASRPIHGQVREEDTHALKTLHMLDRQTGWAVGTGGRLLRSIDGGTTWRDVTPVNPSGQKISVWDFTPLSSLIAWVLPVGTTGSKYH